MIPNSKAPRKISGKIVITSNCIRACIWALQVEQTLRRIHHYTFSVDVDLGTDIIGKRNQIFAAALAFDDQQIGAAGMHQPGYWPEPLTAGSDGFGAYYIVLI